MSILNTLGDSIERNERYFRDELCMVFEDQRITFGQYAERVRCLADGLSRAGLRRQDRVSILSLNRPEYVDLYGACEWAGYVISPLNHALAPPEIVYIVNDAAPRILIFEAQFAETIAAIRSALESVETFVCLGVEAPPWAISYASILAAADVRRPPFRAQTGDNLALFYTSGTTGRPKGAVHTHGQQLAFALARVIETGCTVGDKALAPIPLYHTAARSNQLSHHLRSAAVVLLRQADPVDFLRTIERERVTLISAAPTMLQMMFDVPNFDDYDLSSLKTIVYAAAPMPVALLERGLKKFGPIFMSIYAQTESAGTCLRKYHHRIDGTPEQLQRLKSVGQPYLGTQLKIVDDDDNELPQGGVGEICFKSDNVISGYWRNEAATREALRDGWMHTGDMGRLDADGFLFLVDRKKDMIIVGGNNVYSKEVEDALLRHPAIEEVAVIGVPDPFWGEAVRAVVVLRPGARVSERELISFCGGLIARYKCPSTIVFVDQLPKLPTGKVHKTVLRDQNFQRSVVETVVPMSAVSLGQHSAEAVMTQIWERVLGRGPIGRDEDFFDLGGDSMAAIQLALEIEQLTGREISISQFYENPTVAGTTAVLLENLSHPTFSPLVLLKRGSHFPPLFIVHGSGGSCVNLIKLGRRMSYDGPIYGLQAKGLDPADEPLRRVEDMAQYYLDAIRTLQPSGPYLLAGYSFGGLVAYEMARRFQAQGERVAELILIDSHPHINSWPRSELVELGLDWFSRLQRIWLVPVARGIHFLTRLPFMSKAERHEELRSLPSLAAPYLENIRAEISGWRISINGRARSLWSRNRLNAAASGGERTSVSVPKTGTDFPRAIARVQKACLAAEARYRPKLYLSKVTLIKPEVLGAHHVRIWAKVAPELEIKATSGSHAGRLDGSALDDLANIIDQCLSSYCRATIPSSDIARQARGLADA
jgi:acyl-CoA synthetase (AMP-forming)/AMP-acid ligase II/pimeloyl-ACP methyl ester carboxylesterase